MAEEKEVKKTSKKAVKKAFPPTPEATDGQAKASKAPKKAKAESKIESGAFAVIETGGKQYRVAVGDSIKIEKLNGDFKEGSQVVFDKVLLIDNGTDSTDVGTPYISGAKVSGTLVEIGRNKKVIVLKYKQKSRYMKKNGHRQPFFKVKIDKIF